MSKAFATKVFILVLVVVLGGAAVLLQKGEQKSNLKSDVLATVVTPATCNLQSDIDTKIGEKNTLVNVQKKSVQEIQQALGTIDTAILSDEKLSSQKKELDSLAAKKMSEQKPTDTAYKQAKGKLDAMIKLVVPAEPSVPAVPVVPEKPVLAAAPIVPRKPTAPIVPVVPSEPTIPAVPVVPEKPVLAAAPIVPRKPTAPIVPVAPAVPSVGTSAYTNYINVLKPRYDAAKIQYDTVTKPAYDKALGEYNTAVAAKNTYDTVTKPAYTKALAEYNTAVAAKKAYDTVTKPAYDKAKKLYDAAIVAKNTYDTVTKPAYDKALGEYNIAVAAKNTYDTVTKPAYTKALAEYNTAVAAKKAYDTVTKPAYDKAKKAYDTAVAAKKVYDDAVSEYNNLFEQYNNQLAEYNAYVAFKGALDTYVLAVIAGLEKNIDSMKQNICPATENLCANKIDDDRDGIQDCDDSDCSEDNACKKDVVTCTVVDSSYSFKHSNGSTNFEGAVFTLGSPDKYLIKYQLEFTQESMIYRADTYINGEKINCPEIVIPKKGDALKEPLETCNEMLQGLSADGEDISIMHCVGEYTVEINQPVPNPLNNRLSSFLASSSLFDINQSTDSTTNDCDAANCYTCGDNQTQNENGNCVNKGCDSGQEESGGVCINKCPEGQSRNAAGTCENAGCQDGQVEWHGACMPACGANQVRNDTSGTCEDLGCPEGKEKVNNECVDACIFPQTRGPDGICSSGGSCGNGVVEAGEECDDTGSECVSCKKTTNPYCGNGAVDSGEQCDDGNTTDGDGCSAGCTNESSSCGDGQLSATEECDDGNTTDGDGCDASCIEECTDDGLGSNFLMSGFFGSGKKCDKPLGCPHNKPHVSNFQAGTKDPDKNQCQCDNGLDFYSGSLFFDKLHKKDNSCECDNYYYEKDGKCVQDCSNGLNKDKYPDCKCPPGDSVKDGECVHHSGGRIALTCLANIAIQAGGKACGIGWFVPLPGIGTDGKVSMNPV